MQQVTFNLQKFLKKGKHGESFVEDLKKILRIFVTGIGGNFIEVWEDFLEISWKFYENVKIFEKIFGRFDGNR